MTNWFWFFFFKIWGSGPLQWEYCNKIFHLYFHFSYFDGIASTQKTLMPRLRLCILWFQITTILRKSFFVWNIQDQNMNMKIQNNHHLLSTISSQFQNNHNNFACHIIHSFNSINIIGFLLHYFLVLLSIFVANLSTFPRPWGSFLGWWE